MLKKNYKSSDQYLFIHEDGDYILNPLLAKHPEAKIGAYIESEFSNNQYVFMLENRTAVGVDALLEQKPYLQVDKGLSIYSAIGPTLVKEYGQWVPKSPMLGGTFRFIDPDNTNGLATEDFTNRSIRDALTPENSFFDPITGIQIKVLSNYVMKDGSLQFSVTYNEADRVCFKEKIIEQAGNVYFSKFNGGGVNQSKTSTDLTFKRGEQLNIDFSTNMSNPMYCPRVKVEISVENPLVAVGLIDFLPPRNGGDPLNPLDKIISVNDENKVHIYQHELRVAANAPLGDHLIQFKFINKRTNEEIIKSITLKIRL
jgi:hypothetical protein